MEATSLGVQQAAMVADTAPAAHHGDERPGPDQARHMLEQSAFVHSMRKELENSAAAQQGSSAAGGSAGGEPPQPIHEWTRQESLEKVEQWQAAQAGRVGGRRAVWECSPRGLLACACLAPAVKEPAGGPVVLPSLQPEETRPQRTLSAQASNYGGSRRLVTARSTFSDAQWFDTLSRFQTAQTSFRPSDDGAASEITTPMAAANVQTAPSVQPSASLKRATSISAASLKAAQSLEGAPPPSLLAGGASLKRVLTTVLSLPRQPSLAAVPEAQAPKEKPAAPQQVVGPYAPDPPLLMADKEFQFVPVPADTGMAGYWVKDSARSTPPPLPFDSALNSSKMVARAHETVPGVLVLDTPTSWSLVVKPDSIPLGPLSRYAESFNKDGSETTWKLRRDLSVAGRSYGQMFYTACGTLILRVVAKGMWGNLPEFVCEDYLHLDDEGREVILRQCCKHIPSGRLGVQYVVGEWGGATAPPGY